MARDYRLIAGKKDCSAAMPEFPRAAAKDVGRETKPFESSGAELIAQDGRRHWRLTSPSGFLVSRRTFQAHFDLDWNLNLLRPKADRSCFRDPMAKTACETTKRLRSLLLLARGLNSLPDSVLSLKERELAKDLTLS
jgi:hypothetical protein